MAIDRNAYYRFRAFDENQIPAGDWIVVATLPKFKYGLDNYAAGFDIVFATNNESTAIEIQPLTTESNNEITTESGETIEVESGGSSFLGSGGKLGIDYSVIIDYVGREAVSSAVADDILRDENGDPITDEHGDPIYIVRHGRRPTGGVYQQKVATVFRGYVERYLVANDNSHIKATIKSHSSRMARLKVFDNDNAIIAVTSAGDGVSANRIEIDNGQIHAVAQEFTLSSTTRIDYARVMLGHRGMGSLGISVRAMIVSSIPSSLSNLNPLTLKRAYLEIEPTPTDRDIYFDEPVDLQSGDYFFVLLTETNKNFDLYLSSQNPYGQNARTFVGNTSTTRSKNLRLSIFGQRFLLKKVYNNVLPSDIARDLADQARGRGTLIGWTDETIPLSPAGTEMTIEFKNVNIPVAIKKLTAKAPGDYYSYVDFATGNLVFRQWDDSNPRRLMPGSTGVKGAVGMTRAKIITEAYVFGGKIQAGQPNAGQRITAVAQSKRPHRYIVSDQIHDNRITTVAEALRVGQNHVDKNDRAILFGKLEIVRNKYFYLEDIRPGDVVISSEIGDNQPMRIVRFAYVYDSLMVEIGYQPVRLEEKSFETVDQVREVSDIDNPDQASL